MPKVESPLFPPPQLAAIVEACGASDGRDDLLDVVSAQAKLVALQKNVVIAMLAAEDYARLW